MAKITKKQEAEMKAEHEANKTKRRVIFTRLFYFLVAVGQLAIVAFLAILNADPQIGHYILSGVAGVSALYFIVKLIGE